MKRDAAICFGIALIILVAGFWPRLPDRGSLHIEQAVLLSARPLHFGTAFAFRTTTGASVACEVHGKGGCALAPLLPGKSRCTVAHARQTVFEASCDNGRRYSAYSQQVFRKLSSACIGLAFLLAGFVYRKGNAPAP